MKSDSSVTTPESHRFHGKCAVWLSVQGADPIGSTPEQFATVLARDIAKYEKVMKDSGAQPE